MILSLYLIPWINRLLWGLLHIWWSIYIISIPLQCLSLSFLKAEAKSSFCPIIGVVFSTFPLHRAEKSCGFIYSWDLTWLLVIYWGLGLVFIVKSNCICRPLLFLQAALIWTIYLVWPEVLSYKLFPVWLIAFAPPRYAHLEVKEIQILLVAQNTNYLSPLDFEWIS